MCSNIIWAINKDHAISWYGVWIAIGIIMCLFVFDRLCAKRGISADVNRFYYLLGIIAIVIGFIVAALVQATYNYLNAVYVEHKTDAVWTLEGSGITFMGGMFGGAFTFVVAALIFAKGEAREKFGQVCEIGVTCIPVAHGFGRIGCLAGGCCYGAVIPENSPWKFLGIYWGKDPGGLANGTLRYATQPIEAGFLFILAAVMIYFIIKDKRINTIVYFAAYGIFRFLLEFLRGDKRGSFFGSSLQPSQITSIFSVVIALILLALKLIHIYAPETGAKIDAFFKIGSAAAATAPATAAAPAPSAKPDGNDRPKVAKLRPDDSDKPVQDAAEGDDSIPAEAEKDAPDNAQDDAEGQEENKNL